MTKPVALFILDGWGMREMREGNAIAHANTPNYDRWLADAERCVLQASGEAVGLPAGQMGNSEVGHLNLGAGRVVYQDITRIDKAIRDGELAQNDVLLAGLDKAKQAGRNVHVIGLLGTGGVHSHYRHMSALLDIAKAADIDPILHVITDGRDTPPQSGADFVATLEAKVADLGVGTIASVSGRYYAMDRDTRWERTELAYRAIAEHAAEKSFASASAAVADAYANDVTDEFVIPAIVETDREVAIQSGDTVLFFNFRADRVRQIVRPFVVADFDGFARPMLDDLTVLSMTEYASDLPTTVMFPEQEIRMTLAETISKAGLTQMHAAETEKYPHVTYFFNGGEEIPFPGESRVMMNSPKVATYDLQPEMSAPELTDKVLTHIAQENPDLILVNYANPDMVGHTGDFAAAVKAVEAVDNCVGRLVEAVLAQDGVALVTADHGNCERMVELLTDLPHTYHTTNPVALLAVISVENLFQPRRKLTDVAPTILALSGLHQQGKMRGGNL